MPIKKECLVKSLKSDYSVIIRALIVIAVMSVIIYSLFINFDGVKSFCSSIGAVTIFVIVETIAMMFFPIFVILGDKNYKDDYTGVENTPLLIIITSIVMGLVYMCYMMSSCPQMPIDNGIVCEYPDVIALFIGLLLFNALVVAPLTVGYLRCRVKL